VHHALELPLELFALASTVSRLLATLERASAEHGEVVDADSVFSFWVCNFSTGKTTSRRTWRGSATW